MEPLLHVVLSQHLGYISPFYPIQEPRLACEWSMPPEMSQASDLEVGSALTRGPNHGD